MRLASDIETNGLLPELDTVHCLNMVDVDTGEKFRYNDVMGMRHRTGSVRDGLKKLQEADLVIFHNGIDFDVPALRKVYPDFELDESKVFDTIIASRVIWTNIKDIDFARLRKGKYPQEFTQQGLLGTHKLAAWGYRLGEYKGEYDGGWETFNEDMDDYCEQDCVVTAELFRLIESKQYAEECLTLEHQVAWIISRQKRYGVYFDTEAAEALSQELMIRRVELEEQCRSVFSPWYVPDGKRQECYYEGQKLSGRGLFVPKKDNAKFGYTEGVPLTKIKQVIFNPGSRDHIADRLINVYGWKPVEFTPAGKPKVDETTLEPLDFPRVDEIKEYLLVAKVLGQLSEGDKAWTKHVGPDGRIHGNVITNGAVTGRMTHNFPNLAQVPSSKNVYGKRCRALFTVPKGKKLIGCDAEGLELRGLGHFMAIYDKGKYANAVVYGDKADETDAHSMNRKAIGLESRDNAKTYFYALIYGAGAYKLGSIVVEDFSDKKKKAFYEKYPAGKARDKAIASIGRRSKANLEKGLPALGKLVKAVKNAVNQQGYLRGLDGRHLHIRSDHSALNTLLQSAGAVVMKRALVILDQTLQAEGLTPGKEYEFVLNVHDEFQIEVDDDKTERVAELAAKSIQLAGEYYGSRCPLAGASDIGDSWAETH